MRNFMDLSRALKGLADAFHTIKLKLDGLYDSAGAIGNQFELIEEITLTEDVELVTRDTEPDGTPYNFDSVLVDCNITTSDTTARNGFLRLNYPDYFSLPIGSFIGTASGYLSVAYAYNIKGMLLCESLSGQTSASNMINPRSVIKSMPYKPITKVDVSCGTPFQGTVKIYAVRR